MRSRTSKWFETKVRYEKMMEDGQQKKVTEQYVVDALSFGEAEQRITEEMSSYISGEFDVTDIKPAAYGEIHFSDAPVDDRWYKAKLQFITIDEKSGKEKRSTVIYLSCRGGTLQSALKNVDAVMGTNNERLYCGQPCRNADNGRVRIHRSRQERGKIMDFDVKTNLKKVLSDLPSGVKLVAVSKYHPAEYIMAAYEEGSASLVRATNKKSGRKLTSCQKTSSGISLDICRQTR